MSFRHLGSLGLTAVLVAGAAGVPASAQQPADAAKSVNVVPTPFPEKAASGDVYNVSGVVPLADSRFLLCDNNTNHALLRLTLTPDGKQAGPIELVPLKGLAANVVDDMEDLVLVQHANGWVIVAMPSLSLKGGSKKKGTGPKVRPSGLVRINVANDKSYTEEAMPDFRDWLVKHVPVIAAAATKVADEGGLNVEGAAWDPQRHALLVGVRTPLVDGLPIVVPVKIKDAAAKWDTHNLEAMEPIKLHVEPAVDGQGIRGMASLPDGKGFLITVANATSADNAPFALYTWDGNAEGTVKRLPVTFALKMKAEGVSLGTVGGKPVVIFADDAGGFAALPAGEILPAAAP